MATRNSNSSSSRPTRIRARSAARLAPKLSRATKQLGARIRALRLACGISQEEAAHRAGLDPKHFQAIEGARTNPTLASLIGVAKALRVGLSELLADVDVKKGPGRPPSVGGAWMAREGPKEVVRWLPLKPATGRVPRKDLWMLAEVEQRAYDLVVLEGLENTEIAKRLNITDRNAKFYVGNILAKMGAGSRLKLAVTYWQSRLRAQGEKKPRKKGG